MWSVARRRLVGVSILFCSTGCQLVLGDFSEGAPAPAPATLGDACEPNTYQCVGPELQTCSDDRQTWTVVATCADADACDATAATCRTCQLGEWACNGAQLESCDSTNVWRPQATSCETAELCGVAPDRQAGSCTKSPCGASEYTCSQNRLLRCSPTRDQLLLVDRCATAALCDADKAATQARSGGRGTCLPPTCLAGTFACDGATLERCNDDQNAWQPLTTCNDATSCNPLTGDCTPCTPGDVACSGSTLLRCGTNGFAPAAVCAAPELCDASAERCQNRECSVPGAVRCATGDLTRLEECGNDFRWAVREVCASRALCSESAARCLPPACEPGETRCVGQVLQVCSGDLTHWAKQQTCAANETCDPAGCSADACAEGAVRCNDATLERCVSGSWAPQNRCLSGALCDAGSQRCQPPQCDASHGDFSCSGTIISQCQAGVSLEFNTCDADQFCDADPAVGSGIPSCDACEPLAYSCASGNELHRCLADGSAAPLVERCPGPGGCSVSGSVPSCAQMP